MRKLSRSRIEDLLRKILGAATLLFLLAGAGFVASLLGYKEQGWVIIMLAAGSNLGLIILFVGLKLIESNAPD